MTPKLEHLANLATLLLCVVAVAALVKNQFLAAPAAAPAAPPGTLAAGDVSADLGRLLPADADRSVVVALAPDCGFCTDSLPFYRRLADELQGREGIRLVAALGSAQDLERERPLLGEQDVGFDHLVVADFRRLRLAGTPTVMLVDRHGKVLDLWIGLLDERAQDEVLRAVDRA